MVVSIRVLLPSDEATSEQVLTTFPCTTRPETILDCLTCALPHCSLCMVKFSWLRGQWSGTLFSVPVHGPLLQVLCLAFNIIASCVWVYVFGFLTKILWFTAFCARFRGFSFIIEFRLYWSWVGVCRLCFRFSSLIFQISSVVFDVCSFRCRVWGWEVGCLGSWLRSH